MIPDESLIIYLDGGTTHTRAYLSRADTVVAAARVAVGARDTAREGSPARLQAAVRALVPEVLAKAGLPEDAPVAIVAAGMITSPQGLCEVPHAQAPAGVRELAAGARRQALAGLPQGQILFVPGVRTGSPVVSPSEVDGADIMRGEEVLALGLHALGRLPAGGVLLNLGSHWKAIRLDREGRIATSVSTLSGELLHAVSSQTILASSLPAERPAALSPGFLEAGANVFQRAGLARALYCVRLLEQRASTSPEERHAFLVGAAIASDRAALVPNRGSEAPPPVVVVGAPGLAAAWASALAADGVPSTVLEEIDTEAAFRAGCRAVLEAATAAPTS